ncbi:hypothetical protein B0H34DRAFT_680351 [Crassisporium funariophilum]|nr:hypothetical protein B0H34DRAFT_680351 [Crassisporium funariophilum]
MTSKGSIKSSNSAEKRKSKSARTDWRDATVNGSAVILALIKEAAEFAPVPYLKQAAATTLFILNTIQAVKDNKDGFQRLADDAAGLIVAVWRSFSKAKDPEKWLSPVLREILGELVETLDAISDFVRHQLHRNRAIRVIFSKADVAKTQEYRERLQQAMTKFELQSHITINEVLLQVLQAQDRLSEQIQHRNNEEVVTVAEEEGKVQFGVKIQEESKVLVAETNLESASEELARLKREELDRQTAKVLKEARLELERRREEEIKRLEKEARTKEEALRKRTKGKISCEEEFDEQGVDDVQDQSGDDELEGDEPPVIKKTGKRKGKKPSRRPTPDTDLLAEADPMLSHFGGMNLEGKPAAGSSPQSHSPNLSHLSPPFVNAPGLHPMFNGSPFMTPSPYPPYYGSPLHGNPAFGPSPIIGISGGYFTGNSSPIINQGVGNISNVNISDVGNDNSVNYYDRPARIPRERSRARRNH